MNPFIGQIMSFGGNFAPRGWAFCDGQLLAISSNTALFSILGTTYGGDGRTTFGLPELRGRVPIHAGNGPGLTPRPLGQKSGQTDVTLNHLQIPAHNHFLNGVTGTIAVGSAGKGVTLSNQAAGNFPGDRPNGYTESSSGATLNPSSLSVSGNTAMTGGNQSHNNTMPYQAINYIIALVGTYPSRS